jgi:hypothetical protein
LATQTRAALKRLCILLSAKWAQPPSQVMGYLRARLAIALVRAAHLCLRGSRVKTQHMSSPHHPAWPEPEAVVLYT